MGEIALLNRRRTVIFRVSIIGEDKSNNHGLLAWFLSQKPGSELKGFTNHLWNGITTLEWCKQVESFLKNKRKDENDGELFQIGTNKFRSKFEMLQLFQEVYETDFTITEFATEQAIDRRLYPDIEAKSLKKQLYEMKEFCKEHF